MSVKSDLKIIGPNDKLIIVLKKCSKIDAQAVSDIIAYYLSSEKSRVIVLNNFETYVLKEGANIQIRDRIGQMSRELKVSLFGDVGFDS